MKTRLVVSRATSRSKTSSSAAKKLIVPKSPLHKNMSYLVTIKYKTNPHDTPSKLVTLHYGSAKSSPVKPKFTQFPAVQQEAANSQNIQDGYSSILSTSPFDENSQLMLVTPGMESGLPMLQESSDSQSNAEPIGQEENVIRTQTDLQKPIQQPKSEIDNVTEEQETVREETEPLIKEDTDGEKLVDDERTPFASQEDSRNTTPRTGRRGRPPMSRTPTPTPRKYKTHKMRHIEPPEPKVTKPVHLALKSMQEYADKYTTTRRKGTELGSILNKQLEEEWLIDNTAVRQRLMWLRERYAAIHSSH